SYKIRGTRTLLRFTRQSLVAGGRRTHDLLWQPPLRPLPGVFTEFLGGVPGPRQGGPKARGRAAPPRFPCLWAPPGRTGERRAPPGRSPRTPFPRLCLNAFVAVEYADDPPFGGPLTPKLEASLRQVFAAVHRVNEEQGPVYTVRRSEQLLEEMRRQPAC